MTLEIITDQCTDKGSETLCAVICIRHVNTCLTLNWNIVKVQ